MMESGQVIVNFTLSLDLPKSPDGGTISSTFYWGTIVARSPRRPNHVPFNGVDSKSLADEITASATESAQGEVAGNRASGLNSPGGRSDGTVVERTPRGRLIIPTQ